MSFIPDERPLVRLTGVSKSFGIVTAIHPLNLDIHRRDFLAVLGPSGCGKTTLLNIIAGFLIPDSGRVEIANQDVTSLRPEHRPTNIVVQGYGLFPHMDVQQNIAYGLRLKKIAVDEVQRRVREVVELVRLQGLEQRRVTQLSGGQAQRVALARALIMRPEVLLLDEPLAALDLQLRRTMQEELRRIHDSIGGTFVFVTHDQEEAMRLANRIAVMKDGRIVQQGTAEDIYAYPNSKFVATFIGEANVLPGRRQGNKIDLDIGVSFASLGSEEPVVSVVRPDALTIQLEGSRASEDLHVKGSVEDIIFLGTYAVYKIRIGGHLLSVQSSDAGLRSKVKVSDHVYVSWPTRKQVVLSDQ